MAQEGSKADRQSNLGGGPFYMANQNLPPALELSHLPQGDTDLSKDLKKREEEMEVVLDKREKEHECSKAGRQSNLGGGRFYMANPNLPPASELSRLPLGDTDLSKDLKKREKELQARDVELNKREKELKRKEEAAAQDSVVTKENSLPAHVEQIFEKYNDRWLKEFASAKSNFESAIAEIHKRNISDLKSELICTLTAGHETEKGDPSSLTQKGALKVLSRELTTGMMSTKKVVTERSMKRRSDVQDVAIIYDERMLAHKPPKGLWEEVPERLSKIKERLLREGLWQRCQIFECDEADIESLEAVHDPAHVAVVKKISSEGKEAVSEDIYYSSGTTTAALLAAGGVMKAADLVAKGEVVGSFAIVRPPGHHVGISGPPNGFCFLNNISIAASYLLKNGIKKILLLDWDIHHGDGTQEIFYSYERVLFFSVHRGDVECFPRKPQRELKNLGEGSGLGYNINICWPHKKIRDVDYHVLWDHILVPICQEFEPEMILISAGFDAAKGDNLGECDVTPNGFATLLRKLRPLAPIAMALEGGYDTAAISHAAAACLKVLLGDKTETIRDRSVPYETTFSVISEAKAKLMPYWKCMRNAIPEDVRNKTIPPPKYYQKSHRRSAVTSTPG